MNNTIVIYSQKQSARLYYVLNWLFAEQLGASFRITSDLSAPLPLSNVISYGASSENGINIPDCGLLWEKGIKFRNTSTGKWQNAPTLFPAEGYTLSFDIFSAIFFLLSRYEEHYGYKPDKHGRYPATESILYKNGWLERPLIDEWITEFGKLLSQKTGFQFPVKNFRYLPTYDIDIAYSYRYKGLVRTAGAYLKDITTLNIQQIKTKTAVLSGKTQDPYDSFDWLMAMHKRLNIRPAYFVLAALDTGPFDKNISPLHPQMKRLIKQLANDGAIGVHPSYNAGTNGKLLPQEKTTLEKIIGNPVHMSRQHYIKMRMPETYRQLIAKNIADDYSMGYATHIGFRAGTGQPFLWYDVENEATTHLRIHPFCFMDTTAHFEMKLGVEESFARLKKMAELLKENCSRLITVFHNFSLGTDKEWDGWSDTYSLFLNEYFSAYAYH